MPDAKLPVPVTVRTGPVISSTIFRVVFICSVPITKFGLSEQGMILLITLSVLLLLSVIVLVISHRSHRLSLFEGFLGTTLTTEAWRQSPEFKQWLQFQTDLCHFWETVITKALQTDQGEQHQEVDANGNIITVVKPPPDRATFIETLSITKNEGRPFITCKTITDTSSPEDILSVLPTTSKPYQDTLRFVNEQVTKVKEDLKKSLEGVPPPAETFADYTCTAPDGSSFPVPQDQLDKIKKDEAESKDKIQMGLDILARIKPLVATFPSMKEELEKAREGVSFLETYEAKAKSGDIYKEVKIPEKP